jgi:hypothetical protein
MRIPYCATILVVGCLSTPATAKPITYKGGWAVMAMNDAAQNSLHAYYTVDPKLSIGYAGEYRRDKDYQQHLLAANFLLKRWNNPDSQANVFLQSGVGVARSDAGDFDNRFAPAAYTGVLADWENRRYFVSFENRLQYAGDIDKSYWQQARVGVAPYIGDYGDVHTWLMLQVEHAPSDRYPVTITPLVRLFKGTAMLEAGVNTRGDLLLNFNLTF